LLEEYELSTAPSKSLLMRKNTAKAKHAGFMEIKFSRKFILEENSDRNKY
jgi:hypothetical protein